jgi:hypothetical protein
MEAFEGNSTSPNLLEVDVAAFGMIESASAGDTA